MSSSLKNTQTNIVIAGYGAVGRAIGQVLSPVLKYDIFIYDPPAGFNPELPERVDAVVVCVATPPGENGSCDTSSVKHVLEEFGKAPNYLVKSAVDPVFLSTESSSGYNITYSPEFLRGSTSNDPTQDFINSELAIYGGGSMRWWHEMFKPHMPNLKTVRFTSLEQAAFAKYVENCFLATKVTFFNEMYRIYNSLGGKFIDFDIMVEAICNDSRIGHSHTQVPGPDGNFGFGGHCLPKDLAALRHVAAKSGVDTYLLDAVDNANKVYRNENSIRKS